MDEIVKGLGKFLNRDLMYIIGGISFILSITYAFGFSFNEIEPFTKNNVIIVFILGIAYVFGYVNQEILSLTPVLTTGQIKNPNKFLKCIFRRFTKTEYTEIDDIDYTFERIKLLKEFKEQELQDFERVISLKHIGSTIGSNWLMSSAILIIRCIINGESYIVWMLTFYLLISSIALILLSWIKGMQQYSTMSYLLKQIDNKNTKPHTGN